MFARAGRRSGLGGLARGLIFPDRRSGGVGTVGEDLPPPGETGGGSARVKGRYGTRIAMELLRKSVPTTRPVLPTVASKLNARTRVKYLLPAVSPANSTTNCAPAATSFAAFDAGT